MNLSESYITRIKQLAGILKEDNENVNHNFLRWFEGSKVKDKEGNPLIVYHGTNKKFSKFSKKKATMGGIVWFTSNKSSIESGEVGAQGRGHIMDLYASIKNPAGWNEYQKYGLGQLKGLGYDGAILPDADGTITGFVFEPNQLKSVSNKGDWDSNNSNIFKEEVNRSQNSYVVYRATDGGGERSGTDDAWHGAGIYFTDSKSEASWYGDTIKKYIITINNPFDLTKIHDTSVQGSGLVKLFSNTNGLSGIKMGKYTFKQLDDLISKLETEIDPNKIEIYEGNKEHFKHLSYEYDGEEYFLRNRTESEYSKLDYIKNLFISNILYEKYGVERMPIRVKEAINPFSFTEILKNNGFDGIIAENSNFSPGNEYVVFDKSQVNDF